MTGLTDLIEEDTKKEALPSVGNLTELNEMVDLALRLQQMKAEAEAELAEVTDRLKQVEEVIIPNLFDELGMKKFTLSDGRTIEVKEKYASTITKENEAACFNWLEENGLGSIIKKSVICDFKRDEIEEHERLVTVLEDNGIGYAEKQGVHSSTLSAFVKEQIEAGVEFPKDLFKVFLLRSTKIK